jgi:hypothetical protein
MGNTGVSIKPELVRQVDFGSLTSSFVALGAVVSRPINEITLGNETNSAVEVSIDGLLVGWRISPGTVRTIDVESNDLFVVPGTQFYVRYAQTPATTPAPTGPANSVFFIETLTR